MKKTLLVFCFLIPFVAFAASKTDSVININKIPNDGILLNKGWKFHSGDNPEWAKRDIDDTGWGAINPATDIYYLPQVRKAEIGWFRLKLRIDTSLVNQSLAFNIYQTGASEIYLNGKLIYSFGKVNKDYLKEKTRQMFDFPFTVKFANQSTQIIAVRYSFDRKNFFINYLAPNLCLQFTLNKANEAFANYQSFYGPIAFRQITLITLFLLLGLMSFFLYFSFRIQKAYLHFGIYCFIGVLGSCCALMTFSLPELSSSWVSLLFLGTHISSVSCSIVLVRIVYILCEKRKDLSYYLVVIFAAFTIMAMLFLYTWSALISFSFVILICIRMLPVLITGARKGVPGTLILFIVFFCVFLTNVIFLYEFSTGNFEVAYVFISISLIIIPTGLSIFLASEYARTGRALQARVVEVEQLSEKTISQEREKQQIMAAQNKTLELQVAERTAALNQSLSNLKAAQTQLIQSEKMASLGELTAGIAHEIQNPLNFVNNFSEVNQEMIDELEGELTSGNINEAIVIAADIKENEKKITHHGKRADAIVKSMLEHSRSRSGQKEPTDLNVMADEYMRLAYHGLRAKDKSFNAELITHFDTGLPKISAVPQDIGQVMLNLFNNAFYAVNQKMKAVGEDYKPEVIVTTYAENGQVVIKVRDNGVGIPDVIRDKIMQPFFTTKPTGEGTGLGLSLTYDMIVKGHGGSIIVDTNEGKGSEFIVKLPIN
ncbi:MAG: integral rane sensor signal transduction histidine kinase [Mucilaginibacter sp.]|nr:integral rane sensor signal transduction histidine kinase [Mucilaginibacter sp.]